MNQPKLMKVNDFCTYAGLSRRSVFRLINLGLPSSNQKGVGRRVYAEEAIGWIKANGSARAHAKLLKKALAEKG